MMVKNLISIVYLAVALDVTLPFTIESRVKSFRAKRDTSKLNCSRLNLGEWTSWGPCHVFNFQNRESRFRTRISPSGPVNCPKVYQERACEPLDITSVIRDEQDSQRCEVTGWSNWGECYSLYTQRERERHRFPYYSKTGSRKCSEVKNLIFVEYEDCPNDCGWTAWTGCFQYLGRGISTWQRYRENKSPSDPHLYCPGAWVDFEECEFCQWSPWTDWTSCFEFNSNYERKRERFRERSNSSEGTECSKLLDKDSEKYATCSSLISMISAVHSPAATMSPSAQGGPQVYTPAATYSLADNDGASR